MKKQSTLKMQQRVSGIAVQQRVSKKTMTLLLATICILAVVGDNMRLALLNW